MTKLCQEAGRYSRCTSWIEWPSGATCAHNAVRICVAVGRHLCVAQSSHVLPSGATVHDAAKWPLGATCAQHSLLAVGRHLCAMRSRHVWPLGITVHNTAERPTRALALRPGRKGRLLLMHTAAPARARWRTLWPAHTAGGSWPGAAAWPPRTHARGSGTGGAAGLADGAGLGLLWHPLPGAGKHVSVQGMGVHGKRGMNALLPGTRAP